MEETTTIEQELVMLVEELPIETLKSYFVEIMLSSLADDPNTQEATDAA